MATLYRKYRPQQFADLAGQDPIRTTLSSAIVHDKLGHAYIFAGPRGVGKTTVARLLAKAINCPNRAADSAEPCNTCQICLDITDGRALDVMEIDAASNTGVDNIRDLIEKVKFAPTGTKKKVYIIDEVHMLSKGAFNALLKTLEEPPSHAVFIMATTELHKLPETIISRCQLFPFKRAKNDDVVTRLAHVAKEEGLSFSPEAMAYLARLSDGSFRDALSLLDQVASMHHDALTIEAIQEVLGLASESVLQDVLTSIANHDAHAALTTLQDIEARGVDLEQFSQQLAEAGRILLHVKLGSKVATQLMGEVTKPWEDLAASFNESTIVDVIQAVLAARAQMRQAAVQSLPLELAFVKLASPDPTTAAPTKTPITLSQQKNPSPKPIVDSTPPTTIEAAKAVEEPAAPPTLEVVPEELANAPLAEGEVTATAPVYEAALPEAGWGDLLGRIKTNNLTLHGLLQQAEFGGVRDKKFVVRVPFQFAADRLADRKHRQMLESFIEELYGQRLELTCEVTAGARVVVQTDDGAATEVSLNDAAEIFGIEG